MEGYKFVKPIYVWVTKVGQDDLQDEHCNVVDLRFPSSGALVIVYENNTICSYAPGIWIDFFTDDHKD